MDTYDWINVPWKGGAVGWSQKVIVGKQSSIYEFVQRRRLDEG